MGLRQCRRATARAQGEHEHGRAPRRPAARRSTTRPRAGRGRRPRAQAAAQAPGRSAPEAAPARPTRPSTAGARTTAETTSQPTAGKIASPAPHRPEAHAPLPGPAGPAAAGHERPPRPAPAQATGGAGPPARPTRPADSRPPSTAPAKSQTTMIIVLSGVSVVVVLLLIGAFLIPSGGRQPAVGPDVADHRPHRPGHHRPGRAADLVQGRRHRLQRQVPQGLDQGGLGRPERPADPLLRDPRTACRSVWTTPRCRRTPRTSATSRPFTDGVVGRNKTAKILQQRQVAVDNMPGYYYLYTFIDEETGAEGVHAHYFLFRGRRCTRSSCRPCPRRASPAWPRRSTRSSRASARRPTCRRRHPPPRRRRLTSAGGLPDLPAGEPRAADRRRPPTVPPATRRPDAGWRLPRAHARRGWPSHCRPLRLNGRGPGDRPGPRLFSLCLRPRRAGWTVVTSSQPDARIAGDSADLRGRRRRWCRPAAASGSGRC